MGSQGKKWLLLGRKDGFIPLLDSKDAWWEEEALDAYL